MNTYQRTDDPKDPLSMAVDSIERADREVGRVWLGELDANDRAALDRAKQDLLAAIARIDDVIRATTPPVEVHRKRASGTSTASMLTVGDTWRKNGTMRFLRIDDVDPKTKTVGATFSDEAIITIAWADLRRQYTRIPR